MGNFYVNYVLRGPSQDAVVKSLGGRKAAVTPEVGGCVALSDDASDLQDTQVIIPLAERLSREHACPVLAVLNHDDDILYFLLYVNGNFIDEYDSCPGYFDQGDYDPDVFSDPEKMAELVAKPRPTPSGGKADVLCKAFGLNQRDELEEILRRTDYVFAIERHQQIVSLLRLPACTVGTAYANFEREEFPDGLSASNVVVTS